MTTRLRPGVALLTGIIVLAVIVVEVMFKPATFADYDSYVFLADTFFSGDVGHWYDAEPASNGLLLFLSTITGSATNGVDTAHILLGIAFVGFLWMMIRNYRPSWEGVLIAAAVFGPQLAFVTIRATPAYFLVAIAGWQALRGRLTFFPLMVGGALFHLSTLLAVPAILICYCQNRFGVLAWLNKGRTAILGFAILYGVALILFRDLLISLLVRASANLPGFLSKYVTYISAVDQSSTDLTYSAGANAFHLIYWVMVSSFVFFFMTRRDERTKMFRGYVLISYLIFVLMLFSPVSAFRQSIFWVLPALFIISWRGVGNQVLRCAIVVILSVASFGFQFSKVLV